MKQKDTIMGLVTRFKGAIGDLSQLGREHRRERHKTIDLITKYNDFTWECNQLVPFPSSSFVNRT